MRRRHNALSGEYAGISRLTLGLLVLADEADGPVETKAASAGTRNRGRGTWIPGARLPRSRLQKQVRRTAAATVGRQPRGERRLSQEERASRLGVVWGGLPPVPAVSGPSAGLGDASSGLYPLRVLRGSHDHDQ